MLTRDAMLQHVFMDHMTVPSMGFEKDMKIQLIKTEFGKKRNL